MYLQKCTRIFLVLAALIAIGVLAGCGALDAILPSTGTYKINAKINNTTLDDLSIVTSKDTILPFFEEPVSEDPDITELVIFMKDSRGQSTGYRVTYSLIDKDNDDGQELQQDDVLTTENNDDKKKDDTVTSNQGNESANDIKDNASAEENAKTKNEAAATLNDKKETKEAAAVLSDILKNFEYTKTGNEITFPVKSLDKNLPLFPLPAELPIGKYTLVFQVNGKDTVLYKNEKSIFYLADAEFSFDGIQVHLPGISENSQFIQNSNVILLEIDLDFDSRLEPYVIWYNGKKVIDEGRYSDGAGSLLWKAPEQNGFVSLRAEVFPSLDRTDLSGSQKGISLLVSSKEVDMHLIPENTENLVLWYTFEGDLTSKAKYSPEGTAVPQEQVIKPVAKSRLNWMSSNGTYGLAAGTDNVYKLPDLPLTNDGNEKWQIIARFKPLNEGELLSAQFGLNSDVTMTLSVKKDNLVLSLASASKTTSESLKLPEDKDSFVDVSIKLFIHNGRIFAKLDLEESSFIKPTFILDINNQSSPVINPISLEAKIDKNFQVFIGQQQKPLPDNAKTETENVTVQKNVHTAIWDELAVLRLPAVQIITNKKNTGETHFSLTAANSAESSNIKSSPGNGSTILE